MPGPTTNPGKAGRILHFAKAVLPGLAALLVVGCGASAAHPRNQFAVPAAEAGHLARLRGHLAFIRCGGPPDTLWIADTEDHQVDNALADFGDGPLPAVIRADGGVVTAVRYVAPEGPDCSQLLPDADLSARGNEPFWHLSITADSARVTTPDDMTGHRFDTGNWDRLADSGWRFRAVSRAGGDTLTLVLSERRCSDGMSAARYPFAARLDWGGRRLSGCALEGVRALSPST